MDIIRYSHGFMARGVSQHENYLLQNFHRELTNYELQWRGRGRPPIKVQGKTFAFRTEDKRTIHYHINLYGEFLAYCREYNIFINSVTDKPLGVGKPLRATFKHDEFILRPGQVPIAEFILEEGGVTRLVGAEPGFGKTAVACYAAAAFNKRVAIVASATYMDKWLEDCTKHFNGAEGRVMGVVGTSKLLKAIDLARAGKLDDIDFFFFSNETLRSYYKRYRSGDLEPHQYPYNLYEELGIGFKIVDEAHESFYDVFIGSSLSNVAKEVSLSATIYREHEHTDKMVDIAYQQEDQIFGSAKKGHVALYNVSYQFAKPQYVRYSYDGEKYNQQAYEDQTIMNSRTPKLLEQYLNMIVKYVREQYVNIAKPKQTCLVYCGKVEMCAIVRDRLTKEFPDKVVTKLTGEDPEDNFHNSDICVSTVGSAGTAKDKYGLITIVSTVSMSSSIGNIQLTGRLRAPRGEWEQQTPQCWNLYCPQIKSHMNALEARTRQLSSKTKSITNIDSGIVLWN